MTLRKIWTRAVAQAGLRCRPTHFTVKSVEGAGGVYIPGSVVVGLEDLHDLADQLITAEDRFQAAAEHLIHHELGHALADQWGHALKGPEEEAQADAIAGRFAARLGVRPDLGQVFFRAVGCTRRPTARIRLPTTVSGPLSGGIRPSSSDRQRRSGERGKKAGFRESSVSFAHPAGVGPIRDSDCPHSRLAIPCGAVRDRVGS